MVAMIKLNDFEVIQCTNALNVRIATLRALYQELKAGILSLTDMQEQIDMTKKQVLDLHKKCITTGKVKTANGTAIYQKKELISQRENR